MNASQAYRLDNAARILADPSSADGDIADALYEMRYAGMGQVIDLLITRRPFFSPVTALRPPAIDPAWRTRDALAVGEVIRRERCFEELPILADALEDAGCDDPDILGPMRRRPLPDLQGVRVLYQFLGVS